MGKDIVIESAKKVEPRICYLPPSECKDTVDINFFTHCRLLASNIVEKNDEFCVNGRWYPVCANRIGEPVRSTFVYRRCIV